jgi:hypothetical protein
MNLFCFIILGGTLSLMACVELVCYKDGGLKDLLEIDDKSLHIAELNQYFSSYRNLLSQFFLDATRARKYAITGDIYAMITHSALEYLLGREQPLGRKQPLGREQPFVFPHKSSRCYAKAPLYLSQAT